MNMGAFFVVFSRVLSVILALSITTTSYRAYRGTGDQTFQFTMIGFGMLVLGVGIGSYLQYSVPKSVSEIEILQSVILTIGFLILYLSLKGKKVGIGR